MLWKFYLQGCGGSVGSTVVGALVVVSGAVVGGLVVVGGAVVVVGFALSGMNGHIPGS